MDKATWDKKADEYLAVAQQRTPQEITPEEEAQLRAIYPAGMVGVDALVAKLLDSYQIMRTEYEAANVREHLGLDDRDALKDQLEAKADRQVVVLRLENWQGAIAALNHAHQVEDPSELIDRAIMLLTKVDDGGVGERMEQASARVEAAIEESHEPLAPAEPSYDRPAGVVGYALMSPWTRERPKAEGFYLAAIGERVYPANVYSVDDDGDVNFELAGNVTSMAENVTAWIGPFKAPPLVLDRQMLEPA